MIRSLPLENPDPDTRHDCRQNHFRSRWALLLAVLLPLCLIPQVHGATMWWTGEGDGTWSDGANWSGGVAPGIGDVAWLGYSDSGNVDNTAQSIVVDSAISVAQIQIFAEGSRSVSLTGETITFSTGNLEPSSNVAIQIDAGAGAAISLANNLLINRNGQVVNDSNIQPSLLGGIQPAPPGNPAHNEGTYVASFTTQNEPFLINGSGTQSFDKMALSGSGSSVTFDNSEASLGRLTFTNSNQSATFIQNATVVSTYVNFAGNSELIRSGSNDITVSSSDDFLGNAAGQLTIVPGTAGQGHFTFQVGRIGNGETNETGYGSGPSILTAADSTVELVSHSVGRRNGIFAQDSPGISGEGNVRLNMSSPSLVFSLYRPLSYTGQTMLQTGTLLLTSADGNEEWATGQLPTATIAQIGADATLDLNGHNQELGGLSNYLGTGGVVALGGSTLIINTVTDSSFSGSITENGTVRKTGAATQVFDSSYSNPIDRNLELVGGLLDFTGSVDLTLGTVDLLGGKVRAGTSLAINNRADWVFTLTSGLEEQRVFEAATINITDTTFNFQLQDGFTPDVGTTFTVAYAADTITGASAANMFGYADGGEFSIDEVSFRINWVEGSESIVLTVIPEPSTAALAMLAGLGLTFLRRRRA